MPRTDAAPGPPSSSRSSAASRISFSVRARRGPERRRTAASDMGPFPLDVGVRTVELSLYTVQMMYVVQGALHGHHRPGPRPPPDHRWAVPRGRAGVRRRGDGAVLDVRLA